MDVMLVVRAAWTAPEMAPWHTERCKLANHTTRADEYSIAVRAAARVTDEAREGRKEIDVGVA
jgi:hypothetical protein